MKTKILSSIILLLCITSCTEEGVFTKPIEENTSINNSILLKSGIFMPTSGITVSGKAEVRVRNNEHFVSLENFKISSGPDLKVYLSKKNTPSDFVNIGALESNKDVYTIPAGISIAEYPYLLIHCQQYNHLFAIAKLEKL